MLHRLSRYNIPSAYLKKFGAYRLIVPDRNCAPPDLRTQSLNDVPKHIVKPEYALGHPTKTISEQELPTYTIDNVEKIRMACLIAKRALDKACLLIKPNLSTADVDLIALSINNVLCHGNEFIKEGDIVNIDVTAYFDGFHGDTSRTVLIGNVDQEGRDLVSITHYALMEAIKVCGPGVKFSAIGNLIEEIAKKHNYSVSDDYCGHGIVLHNMNTLNTEMKAGSVFTIEPILCQGSSRAVLWPDKWTAVTEDGGRTSQFEHTITITQNGAEILT